MKRVYSLIVLGIMAACCVGCNGPSSAPSTTMSESDKKAQQMALEKQQRGQVASGSTQQGAPPTR